MSRAQVYKKKNQPFRSYLGLAEATGSLNKQSVNMSTLINSTQSSAILNDSQRYVLQQPQANLPNG